MTLFPERLVNDMQRLPGGRHSFLSQVCSRGGLKTRNALETMVDGVGEPLSRRVREMLVSLDNRKFFQGYAELVVATLVARGAYRVRELVSPGPLLSARGAGGDSLSLSVLSFIHKSRPIPDRAIVERLVSSLERVAGQRRILLVVHRWLPHDLDTEPIRRAVELWLERVESGAWEGPYATYEDERISLEFCLTQERSRNRRRVIATLGPHLSPASLSAVESRVLGELEQYRMGQHSGQPLLLAVVADQPWRVTPGYVRDFLYGRPSRMEMYRDGDLHNLELEFDQQPTACLFRDPLYRCLAGFIWVGRDLKDPTSVFTCGYLNPWCTHPIDVHALPAGPLLALDRWQDGNAVMTWQRRGGDRIHLI